MKAYLIPGLGFDCRIFRKLTLPGLELAPVNWIEPQVQESFTSYAQRLAEGILPKSDKTIIIGHSLGGMMAQEIACLKKIDQIFLVSSIRSRKELPLHFKVINPLKLYPVFTKGLTLKTFSFWAKQQDYETEEEQALFKDMVNKHSNTYLQWALKALSKWDTPEIPPDTKLFQIHGDKDKTFPISLLQHPDQIIKDAGHFMVYKRFEEISEIILKDLTLI